MIRYANLAGISEASILACFNAAFSKYIIPLQLNMQQFSWKLSSENFNPALSVGAFDGDTLIGFILHNTDSENEPGRIYNGGTGVLEAYRGQSITCKMYEYIIPKLQSAGIHTALLEVIEGNAPAHHSYLKIGFTHTRTLAGFKGNINSQKECNGIKIKQVNNSLLDYKALQYTTPSWQNALHTLSRVQDKLLTFEANIEGTMVGYIIYNPLLKRIHQLSVHPQYRRQGIGSALLRHLPIEHTDSITIINVDHHDAESIQFIQKSGLSPSVNLFEMEMPL